MCIAFALFGAVQAAAAAAQPSPPGLQVGWCALPKLENLEAAKAAGFDYVELSLPELIALPGAEFEEFRKAAASSGINLLAGYNPWPRTIPLVGPAAYPEKQEEYLARLVQRCAALKLTYLIFNSGAAWRIPQDFSLKVAGAQLLDFSRRLAVAAGAAGLTVLVQPVRSSDSNQLTSVASALRLVEMVGHPHFQLVVDYSFLVSQKEKPEVLLRAKEHLRLVHVANPSPAGRIFPLAADESDYAAFFAVLRQIDYRGGISIHAGTDAFATEAPRAIAFLRAQATP